jgi:macrolide transport system ATP-binding/permease protein
VPRSFLLFQDISFSYPTSTVPLLERFNAAFPAGWTGIVGPNGAGKSTLLGLAAGAIVPTHGAVRAPGAVILCEQRTDAPPADLEELLASGDSRATELRGRLALGADWAQRWSTLSHGERKRAQLAVALCSGAEVLCLDEPTNHVDADASAMLAGALRGFRGVGLLVSHDRQLLDLLCDQCLFLDPPRVVMRPGGWTQGHEQQQREEDSLRRQAHAARAQERVIERRLAEAREEARRSKRRLSKRGIDPKDRDAKGRIDLARISSRDAVSARLARRLSANLERAAQRSAAHPARPSHELGLWFFSEPARRDTLLVLPAERLPLGSLASLSFPDLAILPRDRVGLTGANGSGKSTLIRHLVEQLRLPEGRLLYMPQEIDLAAGAQVLERLRELGDQELGRALTVVNLLGTDPKRLLATTEASPGEIRKSLIAVGIARVPHLIVLDEPTNHLDLPSIECLERALAECACGLILASHDERFLDRLTTIRWEISASADERILRKRLC